MNCGALPIGSVGAEKSVGNVYHFTDGQADWNGDVSITTASVNVPAYTCPHRLAA